MGEKVRGENLVEGNPRAASPICRDYVRKRGIHVIPTVRAPGHPKPPSGANRIRSSELL